MCSSGVSEQRADKIAGTKCGMIHNECLQDFYYCRQKETANLPE